jgi:hypothetical protein
LSLFSWQKLFQPAPIMQQYFLYAAPWTFHDLVLSISVLSVIVQVFWNPTLPQNSFDNDCKHCDAITYFIKHQHYIIWICLEFFLGAIHMKTTIEKLLFCQNFSFLCRQIIAFQPFASSNAYGCCLLDQHIM